MSKNPNRKSNDDDDDDDEDDDDDADDETLRRGCCVKRRTRHVTRVHLGGAWNWTFRAEWRYLDPKREHPTMSMVAHHLVHLNSHLEVYIVRHTHRAGEKNTISVSTNANVSFCGTYGCSNLSLSSRRWVLGKWMSKNQNFKSNDDDDEEDDDDADDETLRRGCVKRRTRHVSRVHLEGGMELDIQSRAEISGSEKRAMSMVAHHLVHLNSHLEVYIVRHTHRAGEKKHDQC